MLRLSMSVLALTVFLCADTTVQAQRSWWGGGNFGRGQSYFGQGRSYYGGGYGQGRSYYRGGYGQGYWGGNYGQGYGWNRGYSGWPGGYSYYGQRSYWPGYSSNWNNRSWYSSPSYSWYSNPSYGWSGSTMTHSTVTVPSSQSALAYGDADKAALGVWISQTGPNFHVQGLAANSPAAQAGIRTGDVIHSIDGQQFNTARELIDFVSSKGTDDQVEIQFSRSGQSFAVSTPLSTRAVAYGLSQQSDQFAGSEQQGETYQVMRPSTDEDAQQLEGDIDSLKQDVQELRQDLNQMRGTQHQGMDHSQRIEHSGPPAPPSELQFERSQQTQSHQQFETRQQGSSVQPAPPPAEFNQPFAPPIQSQPAPGQEIQQRDSAIQGDTSRDEFDTTATRSSSSSGVKCSSASSSNAKRNSVIPNSATLSATRISATTMSRATARGFNPTAKGYTLQNG